MLKKWSTVSTEEKERLTKKANIANKVIKLGLDLRGGMHLVLEVEIPKLTEKDKGQEN